MRRYLLSTVTVAVAMLGMHARGSAFSVNGGSSWNGIEGSVTVVVGTPFGPIRAQGTIEDGTLVVDESTLMFEFINPLFAGPGGSAEADVGEVIVFDNAKPTTKGARPAIDSPEAAQAVGRFISGMFDAVVQSQLQQSKTPLRSDVSGELLVDGESVKLGGAVKGIKKFTQCKGSHSVKFTGDVDDVDGLVPVKGKITMKYLGNRN